VFEREAAWIGAFLSRLPETELSPLLDIGSSTFKPWINGHIFTPLKERGVEVIHLNVEEGPGVDLIADIFTDRGFETVARLKPKVILCCNVLEHVENPQVFAERCYQLLGPGGRLIITVPRAYPYHRAPIDTMFRPTPDEVAALIPQAEMTHSALLPVGYYWDELRRRPWIISRQILRLPFPFLGWTRYKRTMSKLRFLVSPYLVTFAVFRRPPEARASAGRQSRMSNSAPPASRVARRAATPRLSSDGPHR
jgi:SAM-dependent methyltransferase